MKFHSLIQNQGTDTCVMPRVSGLLTAEKRLIIFLHNIGMVSLSYFSYCAIS